MNQVNAPKWLKSTIPKAYEDSLFSGEWIKAVEKLYEENINDKSKLAKELETIYFWDYATFGYQTTMFKNLFEMK